jgi:16S rRNA (uracil1498-N3)-methyltransferase
MTRRRWIADEFSTDYAALTGSHADHLSRVLRAKVGQVFDIAVADQVRRARITRIEQDRVEFELGELIPVPQPTQVTLALSIFKFDRMEWAIEKCTELGVARILPVIARRTEAHLSVAAVKRVERWQRIVKQAAEQSRRASPPEVAQPIKLKDALASPGSTRIVLSESEKDITLSDALQSAASDVVLAVGPEGGWTDSEIDQFRETRWSSASLGGTILRAETAAIAALAVVLAELQQ